MGDVYIHDPAIAFDSWRLLLGSLLKMKNLKNKFVLTTQNGKLTDSDFVGDTPRIGSADARYSKEDQDALMSLADELKEKAKKK